MLKYSLLIFFLLSSIALAEPIDCFEYYIFQDGIKFENFQVDKYTYEPGDNMFVSYNLKSYMPSPIVEGTVKAQIFLGDEIIDEIFPFKNINLQNGDSIKQEFKWVVPEIKSGDYKIKVFFVVANKFNLGGINFAPSLPAQETSFKIKSDITDWISFDSIYINGEEYLFSTFSPTFNPGEEIEIKAEILNNGSAKNVDAILDVYKWDDLMEENKISTDTKTVTIGEDGKADVSFDLNLETDAYLLKLTAIYDDKKIMVKPRISVTGEKGRFIYLGLDKFPLKKGEKTILFSCFSQAADYLTNFNGTIKAAVEYDGHIFSEESDLIDIFTAPQGMKFEFTPKENSYKLKIKAFLYNEDGNLFDNITVNYDYSKFMIEKILNIEISERVGPGTVPYTITFKDKFGNSLDGDILIYLSGSDGKLKFATTEKISGSLSKELSIEEGEYILKVVETNSQKTVEKNLVVGSLIGSWTIALSPYLWIAVIIIIVCGILFFKVRR